LDDTIVDAAVAIDDCDDEKDAGVVVARVVIVVVRVTGPAVGHVVSCGAHVHTAGQFAMS
jgi:hypothetical protein